MMQLDQIDLDYSLLISHVVQMVAHYIDILWGYTQLLWPLDVPDRMESITVNQRLRFEALFAHIGQFARHQHSDFASLVAYDVEKSMSFDVKDVAIKSVYVGLYVRTNLRNHVKAGCLAVVAAKLDRSVCWYAYVIDVAAVDEAVANRLDDYVWYQVQQI